MTFKKVLLFCILFISCSVLRAQPHLRISTITGFPFFSADTAYEVNTYDSIRISVVNDGSSAFSDSIDIFLRDSLGTDSLYSDVSSTMILPGDSVIKLRNGFHFSPSNYADGDNIIVVWPVERTTHISGDSSVYQVYFVSRLTNIRSMENESLILYPNPATKFIAFDKSDGIKIKQVRITDISGREIYCNPVFRPLIDIEKWSPGLYLIEIIKQDDIRQVLRLQKN